MVPWGVPVDKACSKCDEVKPIGEYGKRQARCKACASAVSRDWYQNNRERRQQYERERAEIQKQRFQNLPAATYSITNTITGKKYVGQSTAYPHRWNRHKARLRNNTHENPSLQQDYNEYGKDAFVFEVIEEYPPDTSYRLLIAAEGEAIMRLIREHKPLYNTLS